MGGTRTFAPWAWLWLIMLLVPGCRGSNAQGRLNGPVAANDIEAAFDVGGQHIEIIRGDAYRHVPGSDTREFLEHVYDFGFHDLAYARREDGLYRVVDANTSFKVHETFADGFEDARSIHDLINAERGWTSMLLESPATPSLPEITALRDRIMRRQADFVDNRVEPSTARARSGTQALRTYAVKASSNVPVTKASLNTDLLYFAKGQDIWFSGWFFIERGTPTSLVDIESSYFPQGAGVRLLLSNDMQPRIELKWPTRPTYAVAGTHAGFRLPLGRWTNVRLHFHLSEGDDGEVQLHVDGTPLIDAHGQTLPLANTVYDRLEVGITANPAGVETLVYVDDVIISPRPIP